MAKRNSKGRFVAKAEKKDAKKTTGGEPKVRVEKKGGATHVHVHIAKPK